MTFEEFKERVDEELVNLCGMESDWIDDWNYYDDYRNGVPPRNCAKSAFRNSAENSGLA